MNQFNISASGAVVYWQLHDTDRVALNLQLHGLGLEKYQVAPRSDAGALKAAIRGCFSGNRGRKYDKLILGLEDESIDGYEVRNVTRGAEENSITHDFSVTVRDSIVAITKGSFHATDAIQKFYGDAKRVAPANSVSVALIGIIENELEGVVLRAHGGVYWVPEHRLEQLQKVATAVETASLSEAQREFDHRGNKVYRVRTAIDEGTIRAVKDAIVSEVNAAAAAMRSSIATNELGKRALERRETQAHGLHARVAKYEEILGEALTALHETVYAAEVEIRASRAQLEADTTFAGLFDGPSYEQPQAAEK